MSEILHYDNGKSLSVSRVAGNLAVFLVIMSVCGCAATLPPINRPLVIENDFEKVWSASRDELVRRGFVIDRLDKRAGVIETFPLVGSQWFEFWRQDVVTHDAVTESSLQTIRRSVLVKFLSESDGKITLDCEVHVERLTSQPEKIITQTRPRDIFTNVSGYIPALGQTDSIEDWIYLGKDPELEVELLRTIEQVIHRASQIE
ncbi:MAG: hypothetical protein IID32_05970 [Planctomycetes bacterium]|nr:hypothetical protein [Planctomycetota bacterium]